MIFRYVAIGTHSISPKEDNPALFTMPHKSFDGEFSLNLKVEYEIGQ